MKVGDLVRVKPSETSTPKVEEGWVGVVTHMPNSLRTWDAWVYVTVAYPGTGPILEKSSDLEVVNESG